MRSVWEKVKGLKLIDAIPIKHCDITSLCDRVAAEIDDRFRAYGVDFCDELRVASGAGRIENDRTVRRDVFRDIFGFSEDALRIGMGGIVLHFGESCAINFDERKLAVAGDR